MAANFLHDREGQLLPDGGLRQSAVLVGGIIKLHFSKACNELVCTLPEAAIDIAKEGDKVPAKGSALSGVLQHLIMLEPLLPGGENSGARKGTRRK